MIVGQLAFINVDTWCLNAVRCGVYNERLIANPTTKPFLMPTGFSFNLLKTQKSYMQIVIGAAFMKKPLIQ